VIILLGAALTYRGDYRWVGHAVVSVLALTALGAMPVTGSRLARIRDSRGAALLRHHIAIGISFALLAVGTFSYGILVSLGEEEPLSSNSPHACLGAAIVAVALAQLTTSLTTKRTATVRSYHRIPGYGLVALVLAQIALGVYMVLTGT
jgi:hypothetical protein